MDAYTYCSHEWLETLIGLGTKTNSMVIMKELSRHHFLEGSVFLKLDGTRSFIACYEVEVCYISTKGEERIIKLDVTNHHLLTHRR